MKKSFYTSLFLSSFALFSLSANETILANNKYNDTNPVSVRIEQVIGNPTTLKVQLFGDYTITSLSDKTLKKKVIGQTITLSISKSKLKMNNESKIYTDLIFTPLNESPEHLIKLNNNLSYLGAMDFKVEKIVLDAKTKETKETIQPRNTLQINNYLLGVVPNEMPSNWKEHALKAQTVSARTYLHRKLITDSSKFEDTVKYQVYKGYKPNKRIEDIIKSTENEILLYNNQPAETFYSSSNGGFVNSTKGYGWNALPYSLVKCDPFDPKREFVSKIDEKTLIDKVLKSSSIKEIKKVTYSAVDDNGRPSTVYFQTDKGTTSVSINDFRSRLNYDTLKNTLINSSSYDGSTLTINGYGWGHGVGMSQYGAEAMASQGLTYKQILGFYYSGVSLNGKTISYTPENDTNCSKPSIKVTNATPTPPPTETTKPTEKPPTTITTEVKTYTVNTKSGELSLRQSASTSSKILLGIPKGKTVKILKDFNNKWYYVEYGGKKGYVSKDFIKATTSKTTSSNTTTTKPPSTSTNTNNSTSTTTTKTYTVNTKSGTLSLRQSASTSSRVLTQLPKGKTVKFLKDFNNKWYYIEYGGKKGYVSKDFIKVTTIKSTNSTTQKPPTTNNISNNNTVNSSSNTHVVKKGDTLYNISKKYNTTVNKIVSLNKLKNTNISIGQKLKTK